MCVHTCFSVCVFCLTQGTWIWFIEWQFWIHRFKLDLLNKLILSSFCVVFASSLFCYILPVSTWSVLVYERSHFFNKYISAFRLFEAVWCIIAYGGSENTVADDAELKQHQKLEKLWICTRAAKVTFLWLSSYAAFRFCIYEQSAFGSRNSKYYEFHYQL